MKLILALGNPGKKYEFTRHNAGFLALDAFAAEQGSLFSAKPKFLADIAELTIGDEKVLLVKPTTYYNETGRAARAIIDFYHLNLDDILILHDDTDLDFGKIRIRRGGRDGGSNGMKSLHAHIGNNFWHVRIGTDNLMRRRVTTDVFVMMQFNEDERAILGDWVLPTAGELIKTFLADHLRPTSLTLLS